MKKLAQFHHYLLFVLLSMQMLSGTVHATGALFCRPRFSSSDYQTMWIKSINVSVSIQDQMAVTHVDQTFTNTLNTSVETIYMFPLPQNATVSELIYWVNGVRYVAAIREAAAAVADYQQHVRQWMDPALLQYLGNNLFRLSIVPVNANSDVRTEITYVEPLPYEFGTVSYNFGLNTLGLSSQPVQKVLVSVDATAQHPYKSFVSPSHGNTTGSTLTKVDDRHYQFLFGDENFYPNKDLNIQFRTQRDSIEFTALSYKPATKDSIGTDSFYSLWISPPDTLGNSEIVPKNLVFTVDVSSSMDGARMTQIKQAMTTFLSLLNQGDKFNIVTFGTFVKNFKPDLVPASQAYIDSAQLFVSQLYALGLTNISQGLQASLAQSYSDSASNMLVFFTDGYPTWGDTAATAILNNVRVLNTKNVKLFTFGVGTDVRKSLLQDLADQNHGFCKIISSNDSIALVINNLFQRISKPVLTDISITLNGIQAYDQYPKIIGDLFWGSQLTQFGLYQTGGLHEISVTGKIGARTVTFKKSVTFADTSGGQRFVPRLWANEKINYLMNLIDTYGETKELVAQIIDLSLRFQILTRYTAFYSDPKPATDVKAPVQKVTDYTLYQNYPNPFNPETKISYSIPAMKGRSHILIRVYNALGQLVRVLVDKEQEPGEYSVLWDGRDMHNKQAASGIYLYSLEVNGTRQLKKMILLR
jgi:Ca-activated chloride channel family protein